MNDELLKEEYPLLKQQLLQEINGERLPSVEELCRRIDRLLETHSFSQRPGLSEKLKLREMLFNSLRRLDSLSELLDDPTVTEIMINGKDQVFLERNGKMEKWDRVFESDALLDNLIQQIVSRINRRVNTRNPIADARLEDGSRVSVLLQPVAIDGPVMTIRKFPKPVSMETMIQNGTVPKEAADLLKLLVNARYNIFVSGGTSSGKTTLLNALTRYIPGEERIITIEDSAELQIRHIPNLVRLETREATPDGCGAIDMSMLIKASLRMRPDRIIVGEVRDRSAADMLTAFDTGHDGSLSTGHANSCADMITRLGVMVLSGNDLPLDAVKRQIASAIDIMVHLERMKDKSRKIVEIEEVTGYENGTVTLSPLYLYDYQKGMLCPANRLKNTRKLEKAGLASGLPDLQAPEKGPAGLRSGGASDLRAGLQDLL